MSERELIVEPTRADVIRRVADDVVTTLAGALTTKDVVHVALTGGTVGIGVLNDIGFRRQDAVDWSRVHLWWSDERWVSSGDAERNEVQATDGFLNRVAVPDAQVHRMPSADAGPSLDEAALSYEQLLRSESPPNGPCFDLVLLGVGPDAHVASLFPGHIDELSEAQRLCLAVRNSPKPPSERLTLTFPIINSADRVWIVAAGEDKREAITATLGKADSTRAPSSAVHGTIGTRVYCDLSAAPDAYDPARSPVT